jgi:hypothetical protein
VSTPSIYDLVRRDLVHRERADVASYGRPVVHMTGETAILDVYDTAIELTCAVRQLIEDMTVGDGTLDDTMGHAK